jgi:hypothetical protein
MSGKSFIARSVFHHHGVNDQTKRDKRRATSRTRNKRKRLRTLSVASSLVGCRECAPKNAAAETEVTTKTEVSTRQEPSGHRRSEVSRAGGQKRHREYYLAHLISDAYSQSRIVVSVLAAKLSDHAAGIVKSGSIILQDRVALVRALVLDRSNCKAVLWHGPRPKRWYGHVPLTLWRYNK